MQPHRSRNDWNLSLSLSLSLFLWLFYLVFFVCVSWIQLSDLIFITLVLHTSNNELTDKQHLEDYFFLQFIMDKRRKKCQKKAGNEGKKELNNRKKTSCFEEKWSKNTKIWKITFDCRWNVYTENVIRYSSGIQTEWIKWWKRRRKKWGEFK